ncbi:calcium homeostasis modulator protein 6-like [Labeo rohita]|uniref:calcium homeostasis modulator protein 6-like n=1 Tax=Labeo rohita TaxID=84645 RepID=UPI0021E28765|nr:calcium homeostasis modulator protein 6-like [Labeo rohita]
MVSERKAKKEVLQGVYQFVKGTATFPLSLLLIGLEKLIEVEFFSCPCRVELNGLLTASIFIGPALFVFALMYLVFRPFKHRLSCYGEANNDAQQNSAHNAQEGSHKTPQICPKAFAFCLIPPVMWIFILLLDGVYVACSMTDWKGGYVFDQDLNKFWCNPTDKMQNVTELRDLTRKYIYQSQYAGYVLISVFSALTVAFVSIYDCCISRKCDDYCPNQLLSCCKPTRTQSEGQAVIANPVFLHPPQ